MMLKVCLYVFIKTPVFAYQRDVVGFVDARMS